MEDSEKILNMLGTDEARNKAVSQLIGKVQVPEDLVIKAIQDYEKAGRFGDAANIASKAGMTERANKLYEQQIQDYEKAGWFGDAANIASKAGMTERAIQDYEKAGRFGDAANIASKAGMTERANSLRTLEKLINP